MTQLPDGGLQTPYKQLRRPLDDRLAAGVCSGVGRYFGVDPVLVRVGFVLLAVITAGAALLAYPIMWFLMPEDSVGAWNAATKTPWNENTPDAWNPGTSADGTPNAWSPSTPGTPDASDPGAPRTSNDGAPNA
ncbi:MAG: PspC domain-containing protein [Actinomycetota bacterium]|nr:PspC domain-containing protein [Actinomycetota bacterium]